MIKYAPALIAGAVFIYVLEYTDLITAPVNDPQGFIDNQLNGSDEEMKNANLQAGLMCIRRWESSVSPDAYKTIVGGAKFNDFADHPRIAVKQKNGLYSTAAGAYQIVAISKTPNGYTRANTWDRIKTKLNLPDFSPASQDLAAIELLKERGGYYPLINGDFDGFVKAAGKEWQSVPGSPLGDPGIVTYNQYRDFFVSNGGSINV